MFWTFKKDVCKIKDVSKYKDVHSSPVFFATIVSRYVDNIVTILWKTHNIATVLWQYCQHIVTILPIILPTSTIRLTYMLTICGCNMVEISQYCDHMRLTYMLTVLWELTIWWPMFSLYVDTIVTICCLDSFNHVLNISCEEQLITHFWQITLYDRL